MDVPEAVSDLNQAELGHDSEVQSALDHEKWTLISTLSSAVPVTSAVLETWLQYRNTRPWWQRCSWPGWVTIEWRWRHCSALVRDFLHLH